MRETRYPRLLAFAQLLRIPNVFTAFADICMAGAATGAITERPGAFVLLLLASGCLYLGGMVWNDVCDRAEDAKVRGFRPIPSGRVSLRTAVILGAVLMLAGIGFAWLADLTLPTRTNVMRFGGNPLHVAVVLAVLIFLYDSWLKRTPAGPIGMGLCRFMNVMLGLSIAGVPFSSEPFPLHLAAVIGIYIVGVTWFARTEEAASNRRQLILAACVMLSAVGLAVAIPVHLPVGSSPWFFPYLLVAFGFIVGIPVVRAINRPEPKHVQTAVKRSILGLVVLDAVLATAFVGPAGLLILLLLLPAAWLGKWVYST
jgi:4-hydroxybenzoate polyprenyltransferase